MRYLCKVFKETSKLNLIIDIGNNSTKYFIFADNSIVLHGRRSNESLVFVKEYIEQYAIEKIIISSVVDINEEETLFVDSICKNVIWFDNSTPTPIKLEYRTPHTLGSDRIAALVGAQAQAPGKDILVIDAGSAITIDFADASGTFKGGNISPGLKMRLNALHSFTSRLPLVDKEGDVPMLGYDTETAMRSGVVRGILHEIEGYIDEIKAKHPDVFVFLTGGDEKILINSIKSRIFADKFLVAKGLNKILENSF